MRRWSIGASVVSLFTAALIAGCGGSGSQRTIPNASSHAPDRGAATTRLTLHIPAPPRGAAVRRRPAYVSSATSWLRAIVDGLTASAVETMIGAGSAACTTFPDSSRTCTVALALTPVTHAVEIQLCDVQCSTGGALVLSAGTMTLTPTPGAANTPLPLVLGGVPNSVVITVPQPVASPWPSGVAEVTLDVAVLDAAGQRIIGAAPYANSAGNAAPVTLRSDVIYQSPINNAPLLLYSVNADGSTTTANGTALVTSPSQRIVARELTANFAGVPISFSLDGATYFPGGFYEPATVPGGSGSVVFNASYANMSGANALDNSTVGAVLVGDGSSNWMAWSDSGGSFNYCSINSATGAYSVFAYSASAFWALEARASGGPIMAFFNSFGPGNTACSGQTSIPLGSTATALAMTGSRNNNTVAAWASNASDFLTVAPADGSGGQSTVSVAGGTTTNGDIAVDRYGTYWCMSHERSMIFGVGSTTPTVPSSFGLIATANTTGQPNSVAAGPDGKIYYTSTSGIYRFDPKTPGSQTQFATFSTAPTGRHTLVTGTDGKLWLTDTIGIKMQRFDPFASSLPTAPLSSVSMSSSPLQVAPGADGAMWWTDGTNMVMRYGKPISL